MHGSVWLRLQIASHIYSHATSSKSTRFVLRDLESLHVPDAWVLFQASVTKRYTWLILQKLYRALAIFVVHQIVNSSRVDGYLGVQGEHIFITNPTSSYHLSPSSREPLQAIYSPITV